MATVALVMQRINNGVVNMMATGFTQERCVVGVAGGAHKVITWHLFYLICNEIGAIISNKVKFIKLPDFFYQVAAPMQLQCFPPQNGPTTIRKHFQGCCLFNNK